MKINNCILALCLLTAGCSFMWAENPFFKRAEVDDAYFWHPTDEDSYYLNYYSADVNSAPQEPQNVQDTLPKVRIVLDQDTIVKAVIRR